jgi:hypothetical protein
MRSVAAGTRVSNGQRNDGDTAERAHPRRRIGIRKATTLGTFRSGLCVSSPSKSRHCANGRTTSVPVEIFVIRVEAGVIRRIDKRTLASSGRTVAR